MHLFAAVNNARCRSQKHTHVNMYLPVIIFQRLYRKELQPINLPENKLNKFNILNNFNDMNMNSTH